ncbi:MAG: transglutaminase family protein [Flavobacteriales bacterium]|nr:transglutaminase family protein [Flavobacteriales bacterium]MBP9081011.1 transglutaminase family protein [Flavobacteriales bacterium]
MGGELNGPTTKEAGSGLLQGAFRLLAALAVSLAACLWAWPYLPMLKVPTVGGLGSDRLVMFMVVASVLYFLLKRFPVPVYGAIILALVVFTVRSFRGEDPFQTLVARFRSSLPALTRTTQGMPDASELIPFKGAEELRAAMDYRDPVVRTFAVRAATTWFAPDAKEGDRSLIQTFSIFKVINGAWTYVSDPTDAEYFATARESIALLAGDCDDHAVLMAASIKAIGGKVRLVRTTGHIYPELCVGNAKAMQRAAYLIRNVLFPEEARYADLHYHTDANGDCWINLDYTRRYPGGPVMNEKIIGILHV